MASHHRARMFADAARRPAQPGLPESPHVARGHRHPPAPAAGPEPAV